MKRKLPERRAEKLAVSAGSNSISDIDGDSPALKIFKPSSLPICLPQKVHLNCKIKNLQLKNWKLEDKIRRLSGGGLNTKTHQSTPSVASSSTLIEQCSEYINGPALTFISAQLASCNTKVNGKRWTRDMKQLCLQLLYHSPVAYRFMKSIFDMPTPRTLRNFVRNLLGGPNEGISEKLLYLTELKCKNLNDRERQCSLVFDEMTLRSGLHYDVNRDKIIGFTSDGNLVNQAFTFMLRGLTTKWKQPLGYFFINGTISAKKLCDEIISITTRLHNIGLNIRCIVCDQGSTFSSAIKILGNGNFTMDHRDHPVHAFHLEQKIVEKFIIMRIHYVIKFKNRDLLSGPHDKPSSKSKKMLKILHK